MKINTLIIAALLGVAFLLRPNLLFAQVYSKQDIRELIEYFKEYDSKAKPFIVTQNNRIDELIDQSYDDLKSYKQKKELKSFIENLYQELISLCARIEKLSERVDIRNGFYDPNYVSPEFNKINLDSAYVLLRIKILSYLYQYKYNELPLRKDICCPLFYIYSTGNKVKSCTGQ